MKISTIVNRRQEVESALLASVLLLAMAWL